MPTITQRCALLKRENPIVVAKVLAQAIPLASAREMEPLGQQLVKVGRGGALAKILGDTRSAQALQKPLTRCAGPLLAWAARRLVADKNTDGAIEAANILLARLKVGRTETGDLYGLIALLELDEPAINVIADELLVGLAFELSSTQFGERRTNEISAEKEVIRFDATFLQAMTVAIENRIQKSPSRAPHPAGLAAAIVALASHSPINELMQESDHPVCIAARRAIRDVKDPAVARHLLLWIEYEPLAGTARRWIVDALMDPESVHFVLASGHRLRRPLVRKRLKAIASGRRCLPILSTCAHWPRSSKRAMPDLIQSLPLAQGRRIEALCDLIALDDAQARCRAVIALSCYEDQRATDSIVHFCMDAHPAVVRAATNALQRRALKRDDLVRLAQRSTGQIAQWARQRLASACAEDLIAFWPHLTSEQRMESAVELRERSQADFSRAVDALLLDGERWTVVWAMQLLRQMSLTAEFTDRLIELSAASDTRIASTAVACLGDHPNPRTVSVITARLSHTDDRVQANAVEALGQVHRALPGRLSPQQIGRVISPLTLQSGNRTRANAIVVLADFYPELAAHRLTNMLNDGNPLCRASAIWAARQCNTDSVLASLRRIATTDPVPVLQQRAEEAVQVISSRQEQNQTPLIVQELKIEERLGSSIGHVIESEGNV